ncbi:hypothetical protein FA95DRAFT_1677515 [Auriscalpium vulgare]|uniref:Uncharacterized protein n=1 Tax=Auriscalpium vulgare TaxID=40419 RepID=A0ACB8S0Q3_9AGAM|nr:hypothetical protein FA95DRAFT_1677515 [Auriscalpium vulgare]
MSVPTRVPVPSRSALRPERGVTQPPTARIISNKRPTHFLALPIGHHAALRSSISSLTSALLSDNPPIPGLDSSIIVPARRLHLTLGVMSLDLPEYPNLTLAAARQTLRALQPRIHQLLQGERLRVGLDRLDIMKPERGNPERAHVLYVGPDLSSAAGHKLRMVCERIQQEFRTAGLLLDDRPLKLHCTILNTVYRRPKPRGARQPFSYRALLESETMRGMIAGPVQARRPVNVELGVWDIDELQICEMGSWGPEGEYVRVAGCDLSIPHAA